MNMPANQVEYTHQDTQMMLFNHQMMEQLYNFSQVMSSGKCTVPKHLQNSPGDCMAIAMQAAQWKMNPYAVAQKTHLVNGTLGYEAQLVNAVINSMAPTKDRLHYEWFGDWDKYIASGLNPQLETGLGVKAWATLKGEHEPRFLDVFLKPITIRNSPLWKVDPRQQIAYLATKRWARMYCPDVILGVYTADELADVGETVEKPVTGRVEIEAYPQEQFDANFPKWKDAIEAGKFDAEYVISMASAKGELSPEQIQQIQELDMVGAA